MSDDCTTSWFCQQAVAKTLPTTAASHVQRVVVLSCMWGLPSAASYHNADAPCPVCCRCLEEEKQVYTTDCGRFIHGKGSAASKPANGSSWGSTITATFCVSRDLPQDLPPCGSATARKCFNVAALYTVI